MTLHLTKPCLRCAGNMRDANAVRDAYIAKLASSSSSSSSASSGSGAVDKSLDTPLAHFVKFLLLTLERDARPLFTLLVDKYGKAIDRDPQLRDYVRTIGAR